MKWFKNKKKHRQTLQQEQLMMEKQIQKEKQESFIFNKKKEKKQLSHLKVIELKALCEKYQIKGYSKLKKDELIKLLEKHL